MKVQSRIVDLRSALKFLEPVPGQLLCTDEEVDLVAQLSGVYRYIGAGGTVTRPTRLGPAMLFNTIKGHEGSRVLVGLMADRKRVGLLLGERPERLAFLMREALEHPVEPVCVSKAEAPCQEVVHLASEPGFDVRKLVPIPTITPGDAGPFLTLGLCCGSDPETGETDVTIHRLCVQGPDTFSMALSPSRHLEAFRRKYEQAGQPMPITINLGLDPAIHISACFEAPSTPQGFNELSIAGALRGHPVELVEAVSIRGKAVARAEIVIEGEILPHARIAEDSNTGTGRAMPEFADYSGPAQPAVPVVRVRAVTHRVAPIMQACLGPSEEHVNLAGIPTEASILQMLHKALPGFLKNVYAHRAGGGKLLAVLQVQKRSPADEGRQGQAALLAFATFSELKQVILVDEDVDPFDSSDVLWAMTTRFQGNLDTTFLPGIACHVVDPSQSPSYNPALRGRGITCKTIFDATVPFALKEEFRRAPFLEVDPLRFLTPSEKALEL